MSYRDDSWRDSYDAWKLATPPEYEITAEEEQELYEREQEERDWAEQAAREEAEAEAWLASRPWWWHAYKRLSWQLYWSPRRWLLTNTAWGRRYIDWKMDRDYARRGLTNLIADSHRRQAAKNKQEARYQTEVNDEVPF